MHAPLTLEHLQQWADLPRVFNQDYLPLHVLRVRLFTRRQISIQVDITPLQAPCAWDTQVCTLQEGRMHQFLQVLLAHGIPLEDECQA